MSAGLVSRAAERFSPLPESLDAPGVSRHEGVQVLENLALEPARVQLFAFLEIFASGKGGPSAPGWHPFGPAVDVEPGLAVALGGACVLAWYLPEAIAWRREVEPGTQIVDPPIALFHAAGRMADLAFVPTLREGAAPVAVVRRVAVFVAVATHEEPFYLNGTVFG